MAQTEFGALLAKLRAAKDIGLRELSRASGVSSPYLSHLTNKDLQPSVDVVEKLASVLGHRDELFKAAKLPVPEAVEMLHDPAVVTLLRQLRKLTTSQRSEFIWKVGGQLCQEIEKLQV